MPKYHVIVNYSGAISFDLSAKDEDEAERRAKLGFEQLEPSAVVDNLNDIECETNEEP